jgi:LEA14-like dessication related protein
MFLSRRRVILIGVIAAVASAIILLPLILTVTLPADLNNVTIALSNVSAIAPDTENDSRRIQLNVYFNVYNPTQKTLTTSKIEYELFANGVSLGQGILSYEDIPLNGRPQLYYNSTTTLKSSFEPIYSNSNTKLFNKMVQNPQAAKQIKWKVEGEAQIESGFSSSPKRFSSELRFHPNNN